ncbi:MAG: periplasmic heavy metal sensor [Proteobacteria bacterium]|nr:periplasmic heavy metal sensor [Pseudomonadota bacterium]
MTIPGTKSKWLAAGLIISVCLNLFLLAGMVAGRMHGPMGGPEGKGGMVMATVPPELKSVIRDKLKAHGPEFRDEKEKMRELRLHVADALAAEPFDPAALDAALAELEQSAGKLLHHAQVGLAEIAAELTPEQRKQWAEGWRALGPRH